MKKAFKLFICLLMILTLVGCTKTEEPAEEPAEEPVEEKTGLDIMFVVTGSLGGGNNVDDVKAAIDEYVATYGGTVNTAECKMDTSIYQSTLETAADSGEYDLIITGFGSMVEALCNTAKEYPDQKFLLFDAAIDYKANDVPNCVSVQALGNQGGFLAGALAALMTSSEDAELANPEKVVGFIGATESTAILDFFFGYVDGVKYVDEETEVLYSFVGSQTDSALTQELAITQNSTANADVIFAATNSDLAVADAATSNGFYAICCDTDEAAAIAGTNADEAAHIVTSVIKDYKGMVYPMLVQIGEGTVSWGTHSYISYAQGGVRLADNEWFQGTVPASVMEQYKAIVADLSDGKLTVSTAYGADEAAVNAKKALCSEKTN